MKATIAASGMALGIAHIIQEPHIIVEKRAVDDKEQELERLRSAINKCSLFIENLMEEIDASLASSENDSQDNDSQDNDSQDNGLPDNFASDTVEILDFQLLMLEDTDFMGKIEDAISADHINAEYAVREVSNEYTNYLKGLTDNDYLRERAADVSDLSGRLIAILSGVDLTVKEPESEYIAIGEDISPSRVAELNKNKLKGIILEKGGISSHCVILSKALGIPCLIGADGILNSAKDGDMIFLDAVSGNIVIDPNEDDFELYQKFKAADALEKSKLSEFINRDSITKDGSLLRVYGNITSKSEVRELVLQGGEGVGLFRSELLFMSRDDRPPTEEEQYSEYNAAAIALGNKPLVIRTLDIGGDKPIGYLSFEKEENPFLGYRAIRFCLANPEIFKAQISAILRAGTSDRNVLMMFPMITGKSEIQKAKQLVEQVKQELTDEGKSYNAEIKIGIMIETPIAAFEAESLAREVEFFSIGTNDLTQYLFAADRTNANVAYLNSYFQPSLLRVIYSVVTAAHNAGIEVDICGQAGEVEELIPIWVAMGIDNLSVSVPRITAVRRRICSVYKTDCEKLLETVLRMDRVEEVEKSLREFLEVVNK